MKILVLNNKELLQLEDRLKSGGDLDDYEIVCASWTGTGTLVVLKEKA